MQNSLNLQVKGNLSNIQYENILTDSKGICQPENPESVGDRVILFLKSPIGSGKSRLIASISDDELEIAANLLPVEEVNA